MKKLLPWLAAGLVFILAVILLQPEPREPVVLVTNDLPAGHTMSESDMELKELPRSLVPVDALTDPAMAVGQTLKTDRTAGDILRSVHLGETVVLAPDERAVAVRVDAATGLDGVLSPGETVGVTAVIFGQEAAYSKVTIEPLRILWVSPEFRSGGSTTAQTGSASISVERSRSSEGVVILAVPIRLMEVAYDFTALPGGTLEKRSVNAVELLSALGASGNASVVLYLVPPDAEPMTSPGLFLPDLILIPTATPEPTPTLDGIAPAQ